MYYRKSWYRDELRVERPVFDSRHGQSIFLYSTAFKLALGPTEPPTKLVPGVKRPGCEADHLPLCSAEIKNAGA
jgi:hypothetical protein